MLIIMQKWVEKWKNPTKKYIMGIPVSKNAEGKMRSLNFDSLKSLAQKKKKMQIVVCFNTQNILLR